VGEGVHGGEKGECMVILVTQNDATQGWVKQRGSVAGKLRKDPSGEIEPTMVRLVP